MTGAMKSPPNLALEDYIILGGLVASIAGTDIVLHYADKNTYSKIWGHIVRAPGWRWGAVGVWATLTTHLFLGRPKWWRLPARAVDQATGGLR
jgi:hypothetical protein